ncbi:MAG: YbaB/EbfC family nucleoid-associated protein, partial [SAR202 cluster bacterium]|nr:YbaB/EbfC family nucleoid-associated protein [SAR202 cluster bacterium]
MNRNMMRQAQKQLAQLQKIQEELETLTVEGTAGGGVVKVTMTGKQIVESVTIEPEAAEEVELLQDMVLAAV